MQKVNGQLQSKKLKFRSVPGGHMKGTRDGEVGRVVGGDGDTGLATPQKGAHSHTLENWLSSAKRKVTYNKFYNSIS